MTDKLKKMNFKLLFYGVSLAFLGNIVNANAQKKPNIIFILIDDMGFGDLSCNYTIYQTPSIDKIAHEGIRFTDFYSASPVCSPSRVGFFTGLHPAKNYITNFLAEKNAISNPIKEIF